MNTFYLVRVREGGSAHVQRVIKALGQRDAVGGSNLLDGLIASRRASLPPVDRVVQFLSRRAGGAASAQHPGLIWVSTGSRSAGCRDVLRRHLADRRFGFDVERRSTCTVLHRLMISGSDRHTSTWQHSVHLPGADALTLDHAYKAMAWLVRTSGTGKPTRHTAAPR